MTPSILTRVKSDKKKIRVCSFKRAAIANDRLYRSSCNTAGIFGSTSLSAAMELLSDFLVSTARLRSNDSAPFELPFVWVRTTNAFRKRDRRRYSSIPPRNLADKRMYGS